MTNGLPSPVIFRKWAAIQTLGAAMERRCWSSIFRDPIYANLFIWLVGPPGSGKSVGISVVRQMLARTGKFKLAPLRITRAGLEDAMAMAKKIITVSKKEQKIYHYCIAMIPELGNFIPSHDTEFLNVLNYLYDNEPIYEWQTRGQGDPVKIINPSISILGGIQPKYMAGLLPEEAWGMGATSRVIMVYSSDGIKPKLNLKKGAGVDPQQDLRKKLEKDLANIAGVEGQFLFSPDAMTYLEELYDTGLAPAPTHHRLQSYIPRRTLNLMKLSMAFSISESNELVLEKHHLAGAFNALLEVEELMPSIFTEMSSGTHDETIQEAWNYVFRQYLHTGKPVQEAKLRYFLQRRIAVNMIGFTIDSMISTHMIKPIGKPEGFRSFEPLDLVEDNHGQ